MRVQLLSDLHFEFHFDRGTSFVEWLDPTGVDILVLAGDIAVAGELPSALSSLCRRYARARVLYVHGNHEYYGATREAVVEYTRQALAESPNLSWLDSNVTEIGGRRFLGTTLWFRPEPSAVCWRRLLNDFERIIGFDSWLGSENQRALDFLQSELRSGDIVITHHLPTSQAVAPEFRSSPLNPFFVCDLESLITAREPALWMFGHTHRSYDSPLGKTRLCANPFGYAGQEENHEFSYSYVLEV
jgi:predicted phosphodiesterase